MKGVLFKTTILLIATLVVFCAGFVLKQSLYEPEILEVKVEVPVIVKVPEYIQTLKVVKEIERIEIPMYPEPREFASLVELKSWLSMQDICTREYRYKYDCDDFSRDLVIAAMKDGYIIGLCSSTQHMQCFAIIGNIMYKIEPQSNHVEEWSLVDEEG